MNFSELVDIREFDIDGLTSWIWTKTDSGALDGPKMDWENSHKAAFLAHVENKRCVIQAGGNHGMYPRLLRQHFDTVYTFEPDFLNFFCLAQNCQDEKIFKFQAILGNRHDAHEMNRAHMGNTGMHEVTEVDGDIPVLMIDDFQLKHVDFIWLDIEGYERKALEGASRTLTEHHPLLMLERANDSGMQKFLADFGYKVVQQSVSDTLYKYHP